MSEPKKASAAISIIPIVFLTTFLLYASMVNSVWKSGWLDPHIPLLLAGAVASIIAIFVLNFRWEDLQMGMIDIIKASMPAIFTLMIVGTLVGTWILSGIVPTMVYYGLQIINPAIFLIVTLIICSVVSLIIGSSWTTMATVGIALMGIGVGLGIPKPVIAGAIISGSYFGDKMSPLSETTNLAPAVTGVGLFEHIRHMLLTTGPSYVIALIFFGFYGMKYSGAEMDTASILSITNALDGAFNINPVLLLCPLLVIVMVAFKIPAVPGLLGGTMIGVVFAALFQDASFLSILDAMHNGLEMETGNKVVDELVSGGGLDGMMWVISLILCALIFGGVMEKAGMFRALAEGILSLTKRTGDLILGTVVTSILVNIFSDQYLSIILPGRIYKAEYEKRGLHLKNLSRTLEDAGTLTSPLVPWNACGAFVMATLGLAPWTYIPFCTLALINPIVAVIYGYTGFGIAKADPTNDSLLVDKEQGVEGIEVTAT